MPEIRATLEGEPLSICVLFLSSLNFAPCFVVVFGTAGTVLWMIQLIPQVSRRPIEQVHLGILNIDSRRWQVYLNYRRRSTSGEGISQSSICIFRRTKGDLDHDVLSLIAPQTGIAPILFIGWMISGLTLGQHFLLHLQRDS